MAARIAAFAAIALAAVAALLFGIAGRFDWAGAWLVLALSAAYFLVSVPFMLRRNPNLVQERMRAGGPAAAGDAALLNAYRLLLVALFLIAALDGGRYRWSQLPAVATAAGAAAMLGGFAVVSWCSATNAYLSSVVRVQTDRGQRVIDVGPYAYVRHPMYAALIAIVSGTALVLGSWLALVPAALIGGVLALRIRLEERVLSDGLDGYRDYTSRVLWRLAPGIW